MASGHVHISRGNTKLGENIPSVNLPVGCTCRVDAPCYKKCYARRGRFAFSRNKSLLESNLKIWRENPVLFERDILIAAFTSKFFRWHSSGDIPDENYFEMMIRVANKLPETKFLCFTKKYELVNGFLDNGGILPDNLVVVFSVWDSMPDNHHYLPGAFVRFKHGESIVPDVAKKCPNFCGDCVMTGCSCWDLKRGIQETRFVDCVFFDEH